MIAFITYGQYRKVKKKIHVGIQVIVLLISLMFTVFQENASKLVVIVNLKKENA